MRVRVKRGGGWGGGHFRIRCRAGVGIRMRMSIERFTRNGGRCHGGRVRGSVIIEGLGLGVE